MVKVECRREAEAGSSAQARYYISSLEASAQRQLETARGHWSMDVAFREGQSKIRKDHGQQNMATLLQVSQNLLKQENTLKVGMQGKRLYAKLPPQGPPRLRRDCPRRRNRFSKCESVFKIQ